MVSRWLSYLSQRRVRYRSLSRGHRLEHMAGDLRERVIAAFLSYHRSRSKIAMGARSSSDRSPILAQLLGTFCPIAVPSSRSSSQRALGILTNLR